jgi:phage FluMu protein Com
MSSVDSDINCPKCDFEEANESWSSQGYLHTFCPRCGYSNHIDYNDAANNETRGGVGSFRMTFDNHVSSLGGLQAPNSIAALKRDFRRAMRNLAVKRLEFTLLVNGEWTKFVVKDYPMPGPKKIQKRPAGAARLHETSGGKGSGELKFEEMSEDIPF